MSIVRFMTRRHPRPESVAAFGPRFGPHLSQRSGPGRARSLCLVVAVLLSACGGGHDAVSSGTAPDAATTDAAAAQGAGTGAAVASGGIVIQVRGGGQHPDRFCIPQWSIANDTGTDIGALLIELEWRTRAGEVLQPVGAFGTMVERFTAGARKELTLNGYSAACADLELVARTYACRDADAVRIPCPGPLRAEAPGPVRVDLSGAVEGSMRGAVEAS